MNTEEERAMIREGICPADVATSRPGYEGPEVTCKTCPDNDGCKFKRPTLADLAEGSENDPRQFVMVHQKQENPCGKCVHVQCAIDPNKAGPCEEYVTAESARIDVVDCEHLNVVNPIPDIQPEKWVLWCRDCGALLLNNRRTIVLPGVE